MKTVSEVLEENGGRAADRTPDRYDVNVEPELEQAEFRAFSGTPNGKYGTGSRLVHGL